MKVIILDTETTGTLDEDRICQLSYLVTDIEGNIEELHDELCLPPIDIKFEAMAVHHITPEMIQGKGSCIDTKAFKRLCELNTNENILVIQNAKFDLDMLFKEGFVSNMQLIDTFRILRALYPLDTPHGLQHKRYQWGLYKNEQALIDNLGVEIKAHDALGDVIVLKHLFEKLLSENGLSDMVGLCSRPILLEYMPFGKHKGKLLQQLALEDRASLNYMLDKFDLDEDILYSINYYLDQTKDEVVVKIAFGKYKGKTPRELLEIDRDYLIWLRDKADRIDAELKQEIIHILSESI